jgi:hypothetical protein
MLIGDIVKEADIQGNSISENKNAAWLSRDGIFYGMFECVLGNNHAVGFVDPVVFEFEFVNESPVIL